MRPFAMSRRESNNPTNRFFLTFAGNDVANIGNCDYNIFILLTMLIIFLL
jgi:hypothetical protein